MVLVCVGELFLSSFFLKMIPSDVLYKNSNFVRKYKIAKKLQEVSYFTHISKLI